MAPQLLQLGRGSYLVRRFTIFYAVFALLPFVLLFYVYTQVGGEGEAFGIGRGQLAVLVALVGVAALLGYFAVRRTLAKFVELNDDLRKTLMGKVDKDVILGLAKEEGEVAELAKSFGEVFARLETNIKELEATKHKLHDVVSKVSRALSSSDRLDMLMQLVLETAAEALEVEQGAVFSLAAGAGPTCEVAFGVKSLSKEQVVAAARAALDWVTSERRMFVLPVIGPEEGERPFRAPLVCAPLFLRGKLHGMVCLAGRRGGRNFTEDELKLVASLGHQIGVAYDNARLAEDAERTHFETMSALALAVEARDPYSRGHSERTGDYGVAMARQMGLGNREVETLRDASRLHDIGKIGVEDSILRKPGPLNDSEWVIMRKHPVIGEGIVKPLRTFGHLLHPIRHHHERLDGSGYPDGLKGDALPAVTRVMMVADVFDALTSERPYRKALTVDTAMAELGKLVTQGKVDETVVKALGALVESGAVKPAGA